MLKCWSRAELKEHMQLAMLTAATQAKSWIAAGIILPIIRAEGLRAVFFPWLVRHPRSNAAKVTRASSRLALSGNQSGVSVAT